jgi:hypothetical protein
VKTIAAWTPSYIRMPESARPNLQQLRFKGRA